MGKAFPKSQVMECNYDVPCENILCRGFDEGYLGNYCGSNITCMNSMALVFQDEYVGRLRKMYNEPQYTGLLIGGAVQKALVSLELMLASLSWTRVGHATRNCC